MLPETSPEQQRAVTGPLGPMLVVAGPGAGKTFCLIGRVHYLISEMGYEPERICAVTYTNKAAEEIALRLKGTLGERAAEVTRGTLHALCLGMLRDYGEAIGLRKGFGIADESYQHTVLRRLEVSPKRANQLLNLFGRRQRQGHDLTPRDEAYFRRYKAYLTKRNLIDFDDIISLAGRLLTEKEDAQKEISNRWDYLLVDEFQDLSMAQYDIVKRLAAAHSNVFAVGDDEQSIFSWTGADPQVLTKFQMDFGVEEPVILDRNRRCSRQIFEAARRLLVKNPRLFDKQLRAERDSEFPVQAYAFPDEEAEAIWIMEDLIKDRDEHGLEWGSYAVLYRRHRVGDELEKRFVSAGIPCRLARGRSLLDDPVIAYVVASLRLMTAPDDPVAVETFADQMLSKDLMELLRASMDSFEDDFLSGLRVFALSRPRGDLDGRTVWRLIYHVENLKAVYQSHTTLTGLVEELLSQRVGSYKNPLEDLHEELTDPTEYPGAEGLAAGLERATSSNGTIWVEPDRGLEIGLRGMLIAADVTAPVAYLSEDAEVKRSDAVLKLNGEGGTLALRLFKALQLISSRGFEGGLEDCVAFDLETTDTDTERCEIVEIGAARVVGGRVIDEFQSMVQPGRPISSGATETHGYTADDVKNAPTFEELWPKFRKFVGDDILVAHNAQNFDVPVLRRMARGMEGVDELVFYDTLPLARSLFQESAKLENLAERFGLDAGRKHHALDDSLTLAAVLKRLNESKLARSRKAAAVNLMDYLGLALALEKQDRWSDEERSLFRVARFYALGRYSDCLGYYEAQREWDESEDAPKLDRVIERLGGHELLLQLRTERTARERYPSAVARLNALIEASHADSIEESVLRLLERVALSSSEGTEAEPHRVNLLTLHSTKGLEFSRVYLVGVEDYQVPGYHETKENAEDAIQEARRLVYVGMTRTKDRLTLTRTDHRLGMPSGGSRFLEEIGVEVVEVVEGVGSGARATGLPLLQ